MGNERVIFSNRFDRPTLEQIEEEMKNKNYDDNENLMSADEFLEFMKQNRRTVPNEKRIANKDKFIWAVRELSETYEIDADLIEDDDGYTASLYMNYASYNGYIKKLLGLIFILSDDCVRRCETTPRPSRSDTLTAEIRHSFRRSDSWSCKRGDRLVCQPPRRFP